MMADYNHDAERLWDEYTMNFFHSNPYLVREALSISISPSLILSFDYDTDTDGSSFSDEEEEEEEHVHPSSPLVQDPIDISMLDFNLGLEGVVFQYWNTTLEHLLGLSHLNVFNDQEVDGGGLSEETISGYLRTRACSDDVVGSDEICTVCQDQLCQENETIAIIECGHEYHVECIKEWLLKKNTCPLCRAIAIDPNIIQRS